MLKKLLFTHMFFFLLYLPLQVSAQIPIPARIGGTLTADGSLISHENGDTFTIEVTQPNGNSFEPKAESIGLETSDWYLIDIPLFHSEQPGGANPGDAAVIHVYRNGQELTVLSPAQGQISVGEEGSRTQINLNTQGTSSPSAPTANAGADQNVNTGATVTLDGSASVPATSGGTLTYLWAQTSGTTVTLSDPAAVRPSFTAPAVSAGQEITLVFQLSVTDTNTQSATDSVSITVRGASPNQQPLANAGNNQTVDAGTTVTLDGSGSSDPDTDEILTFTWEQTEGIPVTLSDTKAVRPVFIAPDPGPGGETRLTFLLTVKDAAGLWDAASVTIDVLLTAGNQQPIPNAGPEQTVSEGQTVILDGSNSTDPDNGDGNGIVSYTWRQTDGPAVVLSDADGVRVSFTAPAVSSAGASLLFQLTVTDKGGLSATDRVRVNIISVNKAPVADAGTNQTVSVGEQVILDGSASRDPDGGGDIASYQWRQILGPTVSLSASTAVSPVFTAPPTGNGGIALRFELTVTDKGGLKSSAEVTVNVVSEHNGPPVADAGESRTVAEGAEVRLDASASSDPESNSLSFVWRQIGGIPVTLSDAKSSRPVFIAPDVNRGGGILSFELTVTDSGGLMATDTTMVNVTYTETVPLADAGPDQTARSGETVYLDGTGSEDTDGWIASYLWSQAEGTPVSISNSGTPAPFFTAPASGGRPLIFQLTVVDNEGLSHSDYVTVTVTEGPQPPTAEAGPDRTVDEGSTVLLDASASGAAPGAVIRKYYWFQLSGPPVRIPEPDLPKITLTAPGVDYDTEAIFQLRVTDSNGMTGTDEVRVFIRSLGPGPGDDGSSCFIHVIRFP